MISRFKALLDREGVLTIAGIFAVVQVAWGLKTGVFDTTGITATFTMIAGLVTRRKVWSQNSVNDLVTNVVLSSQEMMKILEAYEVERDKAEAANDQTATSITEDLNDSAALVDELKFDESELIPNDK